MSTSLKTSGNTPKAHPSKFTNSILVVAQEMLTEVLERPDPIILDPFAGTERCNLGWEWMSAQRIKTPRLREGENHNLRVSGEWLHLFRKDR